MEKPNKEFLREYFNKRSVTIDSPEADIYAQNLLIRDIAKSLAPEITYQEKIKINPKDINP